MRLILASLFVLLPALPLHAEVPAPYSGTKTIETKQPFDAYLDKLTQAIKANKMGLVAEACATCGAKAIGVSIPGNRVLMIFNPHFAVRMLAASTASGIEAPLRLYITETADGTARLSYRLPSHVFAPYEVAALDVMARELDLVFERIIAAAH
ncbi:MAG: DUF302 domain-containing protein [Rhodospirillaceae bacterium]|nr:DUF302 domain-containing protein [Rhodospirillaceae bacterium]